MWSAFNDGTPEPATATQATYIIGATVPGDSGTYYCTVSNECTSPIARSSNSVLTVAPDTTPPGLASALATGNTNLTTLTVVFTEAVIAATAILPGNYTITPAPTAGVSTPTVVNATTVQWTINAAFGHRYTLKVNNVMDLAGNAIPVAGVSMEITTVLVLADFNATWSYNTIAASLHAANATSSDAVFAVQLLAILQPQAPVQITSIPPTNNIVVIQGQAFSMTFGVSGPNPRYQWFLSNTVSGFTAIANATNNAYSVARAFGTNAGLYYMQATNALPSSTNSPIIRVQVEPETINPALVSALRQANLTNVTVTFSEAVWRTEATNPANYTITKLASSIPVSSVTLAANGLTATITTASAVGGGSTLYTLTVFNVRDAAGNALTPSTAPIRTLATFQNGVDGYADTQDTFIADTSATTDHGATQWCWRTVPPRWRTA